MTADCPVCGREIALYLRRTVSGGEGVLTLTTHYTADFLDVDEFPLTVCWGALREVGLEGIRAAVEIAEEEGDRLRLAAHP